MPVRPRQQKSFKKASFDVAAAFAEAMTFHRAGRVADAEAVYRKIVATQPDHFDSLHLLAVIHHQRGEHREAVRQIDVALTINPYFAAAHNNRGNALKELKRAIEINPGAVSPYISMSGIYLRQGRWDDGISVLRKVIELKPSFNAYTNLGTAYFYLGRYPEAIEMNKKAVEMNPDDQILVGNLADAYRQAGEWETAQAMYTRAIELAYRELEVNPRDATALGALAVYYARKGEKRGKEQALQLIARARSIDPSDDDLMYDEAIVNVLAGRTREALKALQRALENGFSAGVVRSEPDFKSISSLPAFHHLLAKH